MLRTIEEGWRNIDETLLQAAEAGSDCYVINKLVTTLPDRSASDQK